MHIYVCNQARDILIVCVWFICRLHNECDKKIIFGSFYLDFGKKIRCWFGWRFWVCVGAYGVYIVQAVCICIFVGDVFHLGCIGWIMLVGIIGCTNRTGNIVRNGQR